MKIEERVLLIEKYIVELNKHLNLLADSLGSSRLQVPEIMRFEVKKNE